MKKKFIILHGLGGNSKENWFQWLKRELEKKGSNVNVPDLPDSDFPDSKEWLEVLRDLVKDKKQIILIGHSLGRTLVVKFLEENPKNISAVYLIATPYDNLGWFELKKFFEKPFNKKIKTKAKIHIIYSTDDPYVPAYHALNYLKLFSKAKVYKFTNQGHFNLSKKSPELLKIILSTI